MERRRLELYSEDMVDTKIHEKRHRADSVEVFGVKNIRLINLVYNPGNMEIGFHQDMELTEQEIDYIKERYSGGSFLDYIALKGIFREQHKNDRIRISEGKPPKTRVLAGYVPFIPNSEQAPKALQHL
jgi:hypothetical protein